MSIAETPGPRLQPKLNKDDPGRHFDNYLCICQYGHCRSVALARVLHGYHINAVAMGAGTAGVRALTLMSVSWADHILLLDMAFRGVVPREAQNKIIDMSVGPDRWVNPYHPELNAILKRMVGERLGIV